MNCDYVKENALLLVYDELGDDVRFEMEQHLTRCAGCKAQVDSARNFKLAMNAVPPAEPAPNLLAASRMRLQEALETAEQRRGLGRFTFDLAGWLHAVRFSPALATIIFIFGFAGGTVATWQLARGVHGGTPTEVVSGSNDASIVGIRSIDQQPGSNQVEIKYDTVTPHQAAGSMSDPQIQQLLLYAAHNNLNSGLRMESVALLAEKPDDSRVREALISALRDDTNPGVRQKSVDALRSFVKTDPKVRDAVLEALVGDASPGVRIDAIHALEEVRADSSVRRVLSDLAVNERNQYIRRKAQELLNSTTVD